MALTGTKTFLNYIGGEWVDSASGDTFESFNPASGDTIGTFPRSTAEDVDRAVAAAKAAYEDWRLVPAPKRGEILYRFANLLMEEKEELTDLMAREMGKVKAEAGGDDAKYAEQRETRDRRRARIPGTFPETEGSSE